MKISESRLLIHRNPELIKEWDFEKNEVNVDTVTYGSSYNAHWICEKGHTYNCPVGQRSRGTGCSYCSGLNIWIGFNDMWATNPDLASMLADPSDGYKYTQGSKQKVDWKCQSCGGVIKNKSPMQIKNEGLKCKVCSVKTPYPERFMGYLLKQLNLEYDHDSAFKWSDNKRYDFYIRLLNLIIETHGEQHYIQTNRNGARTLEEEQANDLYKYEKAITNGIMPDDYVVIDCRKSDFEFIKSNILNSELNRVLNLSDVEWEDIRDRLLDNLKNNLILDWNRGIKSSAKLSKLYHISKKEVISILKDSFINGKSDYSILKDDSCKDLILCKIDKDSLEIVDKYIIEGKEILDCKHTYEEVSKYINATRLYDNYYWSRLKNYIAYKSKLKEYKLEVDNKLELQRIVQVDLKGNVIRVWESIDEILDENKGYKQSSISGTVTFAQNTYRGFIWVYKDFYDSKEGKKYVKGLVGNRKLGTKKKTLLKIDSVTGEILERYDSVPDAEKITGNKISMINKCLSKQRLTTGGYIWMREMDYKTKEGKAYLVELLLRIKNFRYKNNIT